MNTKILDLVEKSRKERMNEQKAGQRRNDAFADLTEEVERQYGINSDDLKLSEIRARLIRIKKLLILTETPKSNKEVLTQLYINQEVMADILKDLISKE